MTHSEFKKQVFEAAKSGRVSVLKNLPTRDVGFAIELLFEGISRLEARVAELEKADKS